MKKLAACRRILLSSAGLKVNLQYPLVSLYPTILPFLLYATPSSQSLQNPNLLATFFLFSMISNIVIIFELWNH
jgi:hypothetical protein